MIINIDDYILLYGKEVAVFDIRSFIFWKLLSFIVCLVLEIKIEVREKVIKLFMFGLNSKKNEEKRNKHETHNLYNSLLKNYNHSIIIFLFLSKYIQ